MEDLEYSVRERSINRLIGEIQDKLSHLARHNVLCTAILTNDDGELVEINGQKEAPPIIHSSNLSVH